MKYILLVFLLLGCHRKKNKTAAPIRIIEKISILGSEFTVFDTLYNVPVSIRRDHLGRDSLIITDSLKAIKVLLQQLNDCNKERRRVIHDTVTIYLDRV